MEKDILETSLIALGILFLFLAILDFAPEILYLFLFFGFFYLVDKLGDWWEKRHQKFVENSNQTPFPDPNPYKRGGNEKSPIKTIPVKTVSLKGPPVKVAPAKTSPVKISPKVIAEDSKSNPKSNTNPYTLEGLQSHLDAYQQKAINSGNKNRWKYGRDYERYIGYLLEEQGWKVIYNGAVEGREDGGIDLICFRHSKVYLVQCKRWKINVGAEYIERFKKVVQRFKWYHPEYSDVVGIFYTTSDYTYEAYDLGDEYGISCWVEEFESILEYPPVKCLTKNGEKIYYLPFDKEFDGISIENGCSYKFKVTDAEKAGYHYHLNHEVILKEKLPVVPKAVSPKVAREVKPKPALMVDHYWNGDRNYPVGHFHAGYFEFIDLKTCRIIKVYTDAELEGDVYILQATFIGISKDSPTKYREHFRVFRYFKDFPILPQVYIDNYWENIPNYRELQRGETYISYVEKQKIYEYKMFKIVHYKLFGEEYIDSCEYGWHYDKGYPEYR